MHNFLFKCTHYGLLVQGSIEKALLPKAGALIPYECPACHLMHLVDPRKSESPQAPPQPQAQ
jgi:hypothetical protein